MSFKKGWYKFRIKYRTKDGEIAVTYINELITSVSDVNYFKDKYAARYKAFFNATEVEVTYKFISESYGQELF